MTTQTQNAHDAQTSGTLPTRLLPAIAVVFLNDVLGYALRVGLPIALAVRHGLSNCATESPVRLPLHWLA